MYYNKYCIHEKGTKLDVLGSRIGRHFPLFSNQLLFHSYNVSNLPKDQSQMWTKASKKLIWRKGCNFLSQLSVIRNPVQVYWIPPLWKAICSLEDCCRKKKNMTSLEPQKSFCFTNKSVIASSFQLWRNPKKTNLSFDNPAIRHLHLHPWGTPPQTLITRSTQIKNCSTSRLQLTQTAGLVGFHRDGVLCRICCFHGLQNF